MAHWLASCWANLGLGSPDERHRSRKLDSHPSSPSRASAAGLASPASSLDHGVEINCIFCGVTTESPGFNVVHEDNEFVVFRDRSPGSDVHLLAVPKRHIDNVKTLAPSDVEMLERMKRVGRETLSRAGVAEGRQRLGFHIPPFFSVNHLHLHLLSLPLPFPSSLKYRPSIPSSPAKSASKGVKLKGFSWFVEVDQVIRILEAGQRVKVGSVRFGPAREAQSQQV
ncbi:hypothetical protein JCM5296_001584 [Sporobolomyces johnsonii]